MLIAATPVLSAFRQRAALPDADVLAFADTDVLRALEAITARKPRMVALERLFAATPRGTALINRIKSDPSLAQTELRVLAHDSDYSRVLPRSPSAGSAPARAADPDPPEAVERSQPVSSAPTVGVVENDVEKDVANHAIPAPPEPRAAALGTEAPWYGPLDQKGTRRAPRYKMARPGRHPD